MGIEQGPANVLGYKLACCPEIPSCFAPVSEGELPNNANDAANDKRAESAESGAPKLLVEDPATDKVLLSIALDVASGSSEVPDLHQEARLHLWRKELEQPGQTRSWYFMSCRFRLLDLVGQGRSVDSPKRNCARCAMDDLMGSANEAPPEIIVCDGGFESVCANDILLQLQERLTLLQRRILTELGDGSGVGEIAKLLGCSHQAVSKQRKRIAETAMSLGIRP